MAQTFTVEYSVSGSLDGTTPGPAFSVDPTSEGFKRPDADQVYRFSVDQLGIINPSADYGLGNAFANRLIAWLYIDAEPAAGDPGSAVDIVNQRDGSFKRQELIAPLTGLSDLYKKPAAFVPQGSLLRLDGMTAAGVPILVRLNIRAFETTQELLDALVSLPSSLVGVASFSAYLSASVPIPGAALTPMPLDTLDFPFNPDVYDYTLGSSDVKVKQDGRYLVEPQASIDTPVFTSRTNSRGDIFLDSGVGFGLVPGTGCFGYHRSLTNGEDTLPTFQLLDLEAGDIVRMACVRIAGAAPMSYVAGSCRMKINKVAEG